MSRISIDSRNEILALIATGALNNQEIAQKYRVTEAFVADARGQVEFCIESGVLAPEDVTFQKVSEVLEPFEHFSVLLVRAGMTVDQIHAITKISRSRIRHLKDGLVVRKASPRLLYAPTSPTLEGQIMSSIFAINYKRFSSKNTNLLNVLIALNVTHKQICDLFPNKAKLSLGEAYSIATDIDSDKTADLANRRLCLDTCTECHLAYLRPETRYLKKAQCPFCKFFGR